MSTRLEGTLLYAPSKITREKEKKKDEGSYELYISYELRHCQMTELVLIIKMASRQIYD